MGHTLNLDRTLSLLISGKHGMDERKLVGLELAFGEGDPHYDNYMVAAALPKKCPQE